MSIELITVLAGVYFVSLVAVYFIAMKLADKKFEYIESLSDALKKAKAATGVAQAELKSVQAEVQVAKEEHSFLDASTKDLQELRTNAHAIRDRLTNDKASLESVKKELHDKEVATREQQAALNKVLGLIDLYSRVDEYVSYGHYETPDYLFETSERFAAEIKALREKQKAMIKDGSAFVQDGNVRITGDESIDKKIIDGQMKLLMRAFNIECDALIAKVSPSSFNRTLDRIEKLANDLEKLVASLRCGISIDYVASKYEECGVQYQFTLKKKDEQDEQRLIREQMREEARAEKEYQKALQDAEKEEQLYESLLAKAREELARATAEERAVAEAKLAELQAKLEEAEAKRERAKSMAEQTRRGHVYVISNVGSFGEHVYKIGLTRRLDPMDRVKELGDASVPFSFDVHAIIYADDAPALETALHREFSHRRVNAVNLRKEFFRVPLPHIQEAVEKLTEDEAEFITTIAAEEYYETLRLKEPEEVVGVTG
ncbi:DUF4041 domain-containing protein [Alcanivorax sp. 1008]|uniref:DUF4041 domain-containing protein n=1 Tax=Alcanivorax sp. 1008 TaxID=2816853 RepID=UPI001D1B15A5|nr:DUF4041 domain-containing protein [Alcanivorax sp. 1008]MCC1495837.1 DUF4041 domain-containing protein [Alcanivorax sp. 1008]